MAKKKAKQNQKKINRIVEKHIKEKKIKAYIGEAVRVVVNETPMIHFFTIKWRKEKANSHNGDMSILYGPTEFYASFSFFKNLFGLNIQGERDWKLYILRALCHEAGHAYIWKLHGPHEDCEEEASSLIGITLLDLIEKKYDIVTLKKLK